MAAIYMWPEDKYIILTTTLYPVDMTEHLSFEISVIGGTLNPLPNSDFESSYDVIDGTNTQLRWFYEDGPYDSDFESSYDMEDGTNIQLRWFYEDGPYNSDFESSYDMMDGTVINKLVAVDTPDEKLQLEIRIEASSTMDLI